MAVRLSREGTAARGRGCGGGRVGLGGRQCKASRSPPICLGMGLGTLPQQSVCRYREAFFASRNEQGSMLTLGAIDQSYFIGSLHWVPVTVQGYWQFTVDR